MKVTSYAETHETRGFAREIKFLIDPARAEGIREWARRRFMPDPHAGGPAGDSYRISSLYFDTEDYRVVRRIGSFGRAKFRIRRYDAGSIVFLERKLRSRKMLTKRRTVVPMEDLECLPCGAPDGTWAGRWFARRLAARELHPVCQIAYNRTARVTESPHGVVRLTLDEGLTAARADEYRFREIPDGPDLTAGKVIVEMKFRREMPVALKLLVEEFGLVRTAVSKYRLAAAALGCGQAPDCPAEDEMEDVMPCLSS
jgi:hypothetical protein